MDFNGAVPCVSSKVVVGRDHRCCDHATPKKAISARCQACTNDLPGSQKPPIPRPEDGAGLPNRGWNPDTADDDV
jgi:hypothetical protein